MLIEPQAIKTLDGEHRRRLGNRRLQRTSSAPHRVRTAVASTLVAWATHLAPELTEPRMLRTRAAPTN